MQYRKVSMEETPWLCYGEATILTKDMKQFSRDLVNDSFDHVETRVVTRKNPELAIV
jgi:hypothetical protein